MSCFLTPDLVPVAGGTYFPPEDRFGRVGFGTLLNRLAVKVWTWSQQGSVVAAGNWGNVELVIMFEVVKKFYCKGL